MSQVQKNAPVKPNSTPWSIQIGKVAGIPIRLHFTFLFFLVYLAIVGLDSQGSWLWPVFVVTLFACVLLHELGHALVALHYHVRTRDITLYPIGGLAVLQDRPTPKQELVIALAGPAVNLVIAGALLAFAFIQGVNPLAGGAHASMGFLTYVMGANFVLALFNLIPAFPMDGGRVLRSALAIYMDYGRATQVAAGIGQALAICLGLVGIVEGNYVLVFIAFFVFLGAGQESTMTTARSFLEGHTVRDAMQSQYLTISHGATLEQAAAMLLAGAQHDFPVFAGEEPVGILFSADIARGLSEGGQQAYVSEYVDRTIQSVSVDSPLTDTFEQFNLSGSKPLFVMDDGELVGILTRDNLSEFIVLEAARHHGKPRGGSASSQVTDK